MRVFHQYPREVFHVNTLIFAAVKSLDGECLLFVGQVDWWQAVELMQIDQLWIRCAGRKQSTSNR